MAFQFVENIDRREHDDFVVQSKYCNLLQSSNWGSVKENWDHKFVGVRENGNLVATSLVLIKSLPLGLTMFYIPRGPVMDLKNESLVGFYISELKKFAKKHHCIYIAVDPAFVCNSYTLDETNENRNEESKELIRLFEKNGAIFKGFTKSIDDTIQPRYHAVVYKDEDFLSTVSKKCRKALNTVKKKNVEVRAYHLDGVDEFSQVMHCTEERKNIHLRGEDYFKRLLEVYQDDAVIFLATLDLKKQYEEVKARYDQNIKDLEECPENAKKKRFRLEELDASLTRELSNLKEYKEKDGDRAILSGALCVKYGKTAELLYAGMDDRYKRYMAPYASFYQCMIWSFEKGCDWCNMGGIEGDFQGGLTHFKANYNPTIQEFVGEFDIPVNKFLYKISKKAYNYLKSKK